MKKYAVYSSKGGEVQRLLYVTNEIPSLHTYLECEVMEIRAGKNIPAEK